MGGGENVDGVFYFWYVFSLLYDSNITYAGFDLIEKFATVC